MVQICGLRLMVGQFNLHQLRRCLGSQRSSGGTSACEEAGSSTTGVSKLNKYGMKMKCKNCHNYGHNKRTCKQPKLSITIPISV